MALLFAQAATQPGEVSTISEPIKTPAAASGPLIDWGQALAVPSFYGREQETAQLTRWVLQDRCRVISLLGTANLLWLCRSS